MSCLLYAHTISVILSMCVKSSYTVTNHLTDIAAVSKQL